MRIIIYHLVQFITSSLDKIYKLTLKHAYSKTTPMSALLRAGTEALIKLLIKGT